MADWLQGSTFWSIYQCALLLNDQCLMLWNTPALSCKQSACKLTPARLCPSNSQSTLFTQPPIQRAFLELRLGLRIMAPHPLSYLTPRTSWHRCRIELVSPPLEYISPKPEITWALASILISVCWNLRWYSSGTLDEPWTSLLYPCRTSPNWRMREVN